ncbi:Collagen alpha-1(XXIV) chain [Dirofilaria immitis]
MKKILALVGMSLLIAEIFHGSGNVRAVVLPYFRHQRYPSRHELRQSLLVAHAVPVDDMKRYLSGRMLITQKRSQPDTDFDYVSDFDPTKIFL